MRSIDELAAAILERSRNLDRFIVAIAGPPGAGKSTTSAMLLRQLPNAAVVQADGFHYDNGLLDTLGRRNRKGAPNTFDVRGLELTLQRIRAGEPDVVVPVFDRDLDLSRGSAGMIARDVKHVLVEGNYLTLGTGPWSALRPYCDLTVFIQVARSELERRLLQRWTDLGRTAEDSRHWVETNDLPNVDLVIRETAIADIILDAG
ncbi:nucleoside/nucleotide kinase family protein [Inquilinus sp.]|jgi:pantothenate kinase|uniref:nucleoside/nucleotide kinase family protein n=1 Tax=Inquilinus sp. TaxID=1932117 RepID=UPI00378362D7